MGLIKIIFLITVVYLFIRALRIFLLPYTFQQESYNEESEQNSAQDIEAEFTRLD